MSELRVSGMTEVSINNINNIFILFFSLQFHVVLRKKDYFVKSNSTTCISKFINLIITKLLVSCLQKVYFKRMNLLSYYFYFVILKNVFSSQTVHF